MGEHYFLIAKKLGIMSSENEHCIESISLPLSDVSLSFSAIQKEFPEDGCHFKKILSPGRLNIFGHHLLFRGVSGTELD